MAGESFLFYVHLSVVGLIVAVQLWLLLRARKLAVEDEETRLETYRSRFREDLLSRARRGHSPDWVHYRNEIERLFDARDERLRVLAAAALATGLGGTMLALIATFLVHQGSPTTAAGPLIHGLGVALFGSFAGVINHLFILLHLLPLAEKLFDTQAEEVLEDLRQIGEQNSPVQLFTETFQQELSALRESLSTEFGQRLSESITDLPQAVKALGTHMDRLGEVVEEQAKNSEAAVEQIKSCSVLVADSSSNLVPAAQQLADSADQLLAMPDKLGSVLETGREDWVDRLQQEQKEARDELFEQVRLLRKGAEEREIQLQSVVVDVRETLSRFPEQLAEKVKGLFYGLQEDLSQELSAYLSELRNRLADDHEALAQSVFQEWRNNVSAVVREVFAEISDEIESRIAGPMESTSKELAEVSARLPEVAERLETAHRDWVESHEEALVGWREAGSTVGEAAEKLANGNARLGDVVLALREGADQMERVAHSTNGFQDTLQNVLREAAERQYEHFHPLHEEVGNIVHELRGQFNTTLSEQSQFIRSLIEQLLRGRDQAPGEVNT